MQRRSMLAAAAIIVALPVGWQVGYSNRPVITEAEAAGGVVTAPNSVAPDRYVYYPGTEVLAEDEVRVIACGTGMPDQRRDQASACFLFEFGNGEKLIFDIGSGSMRNLNALMIPAEYLTKVIISHLHTDHWGDLDALWAGGWTAGRPVPLEIWGPSGMQDDMGTAMQSTISSRRSTGIIRPAPSRSRLYPATSQCTSLTTRT
jgi:hypothetical protein